MKIQELEKIWAEIISTIDIYFDNNKTDLINIIDAYTQEINCLKVTPLDGKDQKYLEIYEKLYPELSQLNSHIILKLHQSMENNWFDNFENNRPVRNEHFFYYLIGYIFNLENYKRQHCQMPGLTSALACFLLSQDYSEEKEFHNQKK